MFGWTFAPGDKAKDLTMKKLCFGSLVGLTLNFGEGESPLPCRNGQAFRAIQES
jgi:hypothetical protein